MPVSDMIAIVSLVFNIIVASVGLTWGIGRVRDAVRDEVEEHKRETDGKIDSLRLGINEMGTAIRSKITDVELHMRDNYVRRDTFSRFMDSISEVIRLSLEKIEKRLDRMENKLDGANVNGAK